jgi:hypothetical protein
MVEHFGGLVTVPNGISCSFPFGHKLCSPFPEDDPKCKFSGRCFKSLSSSAAATHLPCCSGMAPPTCSGDQGQH